MRGGPSKVVEKMPASSIVIQKGTANLIQEVREAVIARLVLGEATAANLANAMHQIGVIRGAISGEIQTEQAQILNDVIDGRSVSLDMDQELLGVMGTTSSLEDSIHFTRINVGR
jgi:hypothetical protein